MTVDRETLDRMLRGGAARVRAARDRLTELDSHGGDGDHGTTMARAMDRLEEALDGSAEPAALLRAVGWAIMGVDGGAIGPLLGSFFMSSAKVANDDSSLADLFEAGLAGVLKNTRARVGDKTLIDALEPAVAALRAVENEGAPLPEALARAAEAAERGAESTIDLEARFGRAKNLGPDSRGHADPGATSIALLFRGFHEGISQEGSGE
ncbi:MAG: dihydroxyacetone kinase subunit DhaL [Planctomycetota bacterium]